MRPKAELKFAQLDLVVIMEKKHEKGHKKFCP
jgi:hypothetical protein